MDKLLKVLLDIKEVKFRLDDDTADRLNRKYSCSFLMLFAVFVSVRQYWGEAIHCWCPEQCASNHEKYANMYCWVSETYYVPFEDAMPQRDDPREPKITYYQWTPIILVTQACLFVLPCFVWRVLNRRSGINIGVIMEAAIASQRATYAETREKTLRYAVHLLDRYLLAQRESRTGCLIRLKEVVSKHCILVYGRVYGNYLTFCYVVTKLLYVGNAVGQLFLLDVVLGYEYHLFGIHVMRHLIFGEQWTPSERFPRVTLCDFKIRQNTNVHQYTVQCVLPINLFNEKIFTIVWFWLFFMCLISFVSLIHWLCKLVHLPSQLHFVKRQLRAMESLSHEPIHLKKFTENYLRRDGLFIIRLIAKNAGDLVATEILVGLWESYGPKHRLLSDMSKSKRKMRLAGKVNSAHNQTENAEARQALTSNTQHMEVV